VSEFEFTVDVLVMGGGACGTVAALAASDAGAEVLLVEADARPTGTTGMSMGVFCAAGTRLQAAAGEQDDGATFFADIMAKTRGQTDPEIAHALAHNSGPTLDWLFERHQLPLALDTGFKPAYGNTRMRVHGWAGHAGQDLLELLHQKVADAGVMVLNPARVVEAISDADGRVLGVEIERPDGTREQVGCQALVIASGGFAGNHTMVAQHIPEMAEARNNGHEGSRGDGIRLGRQLGAALGDMGAFQGYAMLTQPQGISVPPGFVIEGAVLVNTEGRRFVDEKDDIAGMVHPVMAQPGGYVWVIFDEEIERRNAYQPDTRTLSQLNAARKGANAEALAERIGVDAAALADSLAEARQARTEGRPDAVGRVWGEDSPPWGPLGAFKVVGAIYHTQGGLQIDRNARVLREDGTALPNLFAGGGAARSVSGPSSWGYLPAMGLCTAVTLGRLAGEGAATVARG
jgi:fumarate reductase flavoprotein subunit